MKKFKKPILTKKNKMPFWKRKKEKRKPAPLPPCTCPMCRMSNLLVQKIEANPSLLESREGLREALGHFVPNPVYLDKETSLEGLLKKAKELEQKCDLSEARYSYHKLAHLAPFRDIPIGKAKEYMLSYLEFEERSKEKFRPPEEWISFQAHSLVTSEEAISLLREAYQEITGEKVES
jgi:hypothetical protein